MSEPESISRVCRDASHNGDTFCAVRQLYDSLRKGGVNLPGIVTDWSLRRRQQCARNVRCCWRLLREPSSPSKAFMPRVCYLQTANGASGNRNPVRAGLAPKGMETRGHDPLTPCLQSKCSTRLSYVPKAEDVGFEPTVPLPTQLLSREPL